MTSAAPPAPLAELRLFGPVTLQGVDGRHAVALPSRRVRALLAFAALQRSGVASRTRLAGMFWSERPEAQARASLRQALTELKAALSHFDAPVVDISRETVGVRLDALLVDVLDLSAALERGDAEALTAILRGVGSDVLCDEPAISTLHQEWLDQTRGDFDRSLATGVHKLLSRLGKTDANTTRALADQFLRRQPLDEEATSAAMRAEVALGAAAAAVMRFAAFRKALQRDLQVKPGPSVQAALRVALGASIASNAPAFAASEGSREPGVASPLPPSVVVAAFAGEPAVARLVAGVREDVMAGLSRFRELAVVSEPREVPEVSRAQWADSGEAYLLAGEGQVRGAGARLVVQLVRMADGAVVWSERGELGSGASGAMIDRLVARVVGAVLPVIEGDLAPRLARTPPSVYGRFLLARDRAAHAADWEEARAAADDLEQLIADAPTSSLAYLPLARLYNTDFGFTRAGSSGASERLRAFDLAKAALALDRSHVHGYTVMGWCYLWRRSWEAARRHFDQAVELNPFNADRLMEVGFGSLFLGDLDRARRLLERCLVINPAPKDGFFMDLGLLELIEGRHELAQAHFDMIASPSVFDELYMSANAVLAGAPDKDRATRAAARVAAIWPSHIPRNPENMTAWFASAHPFRSDAVARSLLSAVHEALDLAI